MNRESHRNENLGRTRRNQPKTGAKGISRKPENTNAGWKTMLPTIVAPYVSEDPKREKAVTSEMEKAAILCLSEAKRRKPKILRGAPEEIEYIIKLHYPLWGVPWQGKCIIVDGLGLSSATVSHSQSPSVIDFTEDIRRSSVSFDLFRKTLGAHGQTFRQFISTKEEVIEAVIGEGPVLESLSSLIEQGRSTMEKIGRDVALVPPKFLWEEAEGKARSLIGEWQRSQTEIDALQCGLEILKREVEYHKGKVSLEVEQIWREYEERTSKLKEQVEKTVRQLNRQREKETILAVKLYEGKVEKMTGEERRLRQKIEKLTGVLEEQRKRRQDSRRRYPKRSTSRIDRTIETYQEKIRHLTKDARNLTKSMKETRGRKDKTLREIEERHKNMAARETEKLEILEQARNLETSKKRGETRQMEEASFFIEAQIGRLLERKTSYLRALEDKALPLKTDETALIGIPVYFVRYRSPRRTRTDVYSPVTAASYDGIVRKIQRAMLSFDLEARIKLFLVPRSAELGDLISKNLKKSLETDPVLREDISEIGKSRNLLELSTFKDEATKGMSQLEKEGWVSAKEKEDILCIYAK